MRSVGVQSPHNPHSKVQSRKLQQNKPPGVYTFFLF